MKATMKDVFCLKSKRALSALFLCLSLTACNDYPVANMPDEPLAQPLELIIEPKKVAMTDTWAAGIKDDGTLWTWGSGGGKIRKTTTGKPEDPTPMQVAGVDDAVAISGGSSHMLLLKKDGTVWGWGSNSHGTIDPNDKAYAIYELKKIEGLPEIVSISAGSDHSFFIDKKGDVYVIGSNKTGLMNGVDEPIKVPLKLDKLNQIVEIYNEGGIVLALNSQGEVYTTGSSTYSLGREVKITKDKNIHYYPAEKVNLPRKAVDIAVTGIGCMALLDNGEVWVWGNSSLAGLGLPKGEAPDFPIKHPDLKRIVNIGDRSAVDVDGNLYMWGEVGYGNPDAPSSKIYRRPVKIAENVNPTMLIHGNNVSAVLDKQGHLYTWGWDKYGQLGTGQLPGKEVSKKEVMTLHKSLFTTH
ncbi:RCC1 domain-containing protein [Moraxella sp. ZY210820]|uniref:RCC1 domain-containing protein n=1 Tax=unclassified Moraxella TaxID=2685852 RepID=UPI00272FDEFC|nr:RCC1 domain-containing protein [Moraxella sp. ZY210820]WLF84547.1 hypothetical protein LU301_03470 [Moraxella sp. ZY210820]